MWLQKVIFLCAFLAVSTQDNEQEEESMSPKENEKRLSEDVLTLLEHFKQPDPVGLPRAVIPDPYLVPDMRQSMTLGMMYFTHTAVYGISKFRILYINAELRRMEVQAALSIDALQARGNYSVSSFFGSPEGPFTVNVTNLSVTAKAALGVERDGKLKAQDIMIDLGFDTIAADFENLGLFGGMLQSMINTGGTFLFDSIKPYVLKEAYTKVRTEIDTKLEEFAGDLQFPNSISPLDMVIIDARKKVRDSDLDPYHIKDFERTTNFITVALYNTWVTGISSFHRVGNITLKIENKTATTDFEIGTQKLEGTTHWDVSAVSGFVSKGGTATFSVEYINVKVILAQSLDTREKPILKDLNISIGNIQIRCDGFGTIDYIVEFAVNIFPNLLRIQVMNALEGPLKERIQEELNTLNIEDIIKDELLKLDEMKGTGFRLSALRSTETDQSLYDEDQFFNF